MMLLLVLLLCVAVAEDDTVRTVSAHPSGREQHGDFHAKNLAA